MDQILWCDYSYETSLAVLSHGTISCSGFSKMKFGYFCQIFILATSGNKRVMTSHIVSASHRQAYNTRLGSLRQWYRLHNQIP